MPLAYPAPDRTDAAGAAPNGGWTQITGPHAVYYAGYVYFGYMDGSNGNVELNWFRFSDESIGTPIVLHAALDVDTHDAPSLYVRDDGFLLVTYTRHDADDLIRKRISTASLDTDPTLASGFAAEATHDIGGTAMTYTSLGLFDGSIAMTVRDWVNGTSTGSMVQSSSPDGGSWASQSVTVQETGVNHYFMPHFSPGRIDYAISNGNGYNDSGVNVFHFYRTPAGYFKTDGTPITSPPFATSELTTAYNPSGSAWPSGMAIDASGAPVILSEAVNTPATGHVFTINYSRWNGSSWDNTTITTLDDTGLSLVAHSALDNETAAKVWVVKPVSSVYEVFEYFTLDQGATWSSRQITSASASTGHVYPVNVKGWPMALVLTGSYTTYLSNSVGVTALR